MEEIINRLGQKLYVDNHHVGYLIKWNLISQLCKKWRCNRDPDSTRVEEMLKYYKDGGYIPPFIHLAELPGEGLICYDGNHRREVFNHVSGDVECIIDVLFNATQEQVIKAFENINKSVQLPMIYLDNDQLGTDIKNNIIALVKRYETQHRAFLSPSPRYQAPNFNRDILVDNLYSIYKSFAGRIDLNKLEELLDQLNVSYGHGILCRPHNEYGKKIIAKCQKHNFWLFLNRTISFDHLMIIYERQ